VNQKMNQWYEENTPLEGKKCYEVYHNKDEPCDPCPTLRCMETGEIENENIRGFPESEVEWIELFSYPMKDAETGDVKGVVEFVRDITKRRKAVTRQRHLTSVLRSIRNVNQLLVKENERDKLIERVCDNLTEFRGYYNAWIALFDESNELVGSAQSGLGDSFAKMRRVLEEGGLPERVQNTLTQSGVIITEDSPSICKDCPLAEEYRGRTSLTVRLAYEGTVYGLLAVSIPNAFIDDEEEHGLIEEVAGDIAYGLHDIAVENDRRSARAELKTEKKKFQEIFNNANDPMYLHELDENGMPGKFVEVNDPACQALGYQREELLQVSPADIDATEARKDVPSIMKQLVDRGELTFEITHRTKDGNKIPVEISSHVFTLEGKTRVLSIARDITARRKAEWELRRQHMAMESSVDGMAILNEDEEYVYVNEAHADIYGYDAPEELIGRSWKVLYEGKQLKRFEEVVMPKLLEEGEWCGEAMGKRKDGGKFPQEVSLTTLEGGGLICVVRDVTARKRAEKKLKENERRFRNYLERSPLGIFVADEKGNYVSVNRAAIRITGYKRNELLGMNLLELIPEEYRDEAQANFQTLSEQEEASIEVPFIRKDGAKRYWNVKSVKVSDGRFLGFVGDITERRELEDQIKLDRQKLQESFVELAETTSRVLGVRDPYTQEHEQRVAELAREVGRRMGLEEERSLGLYLGGLLHDIGKIVVPETILTKPGELTDIEWQMIKSHPEVGYDKILKDTDFPWPVAEMTLHHHERLDGSGYPDGLKGDELTKEVRILAAVDVVEAMSTRRPYRAARTKKQTLNVIKEGRGNKYDPEVVDVIVDMVKEGEIKFGDK
ncbi:PAS domain S-box protein, partial [Candidatus Bipolaricaulota bacterium]|nr:PAS domain S-box protein [Candidatus Bipolaricaulota bacterium]